MFTKALPQQRFEFILSRLDTMADVNVNAPSGQAPTMAPPVRTVIRSYHASDGAFTTSSTIPVIYIQQFWDTVQYDKSAGCYRCQQDEQWFDLTKDTLREALQITPVNNNQAFTSPPSSDALINFVNELGYPKCLDLKGQGLSCYKFFGVSSLEPILIMLRGSRKNSPNPSILSLMTKGIWQHKFHPRPDSPLHLPNEELVLGYLKFSAKGTKREVFGMPIPGSLITADIQKASYYKEYLAKLAKHRRYLAVPKPVSSTQPEPTSVPAKPYGKKFKLTTEISDKPSKATKSRHGFVSKKCKPISTLRSVDESVAEDVPAKEPHVDAEEADIQRALEESLKSMYDVPWGPLPPVVSMEPEPEKYQSLPEVPGKGKAKVSEEQVAHDLLNLQKPKKKSPADQYIFQRRTSTPTGSFGHDESSSLYAKLGLSDSEEESEEVVPEADAGGQTRSNPDEQAEGEGQDVPDPGNAEESLPMPSPVVHAGSDHEHMDLDMADVLPQPPHEQMDEGFTATTYPKVQENLKLTVEEHVLLKEPASSSGTLSSLQHLTKDLSFAESMVLVTIQQDMSSIPLMTTPTIDLTSRPESHKVHQQLKATATETTATTTTTLLPPPYQQQQSTAKAIMMKRNGELEHIMANLIQENKGLEQRLDSHGARLYTLKQLDIPHQVSKAINEVVTEAVDWAMQAPLRNRFRDLPEADIKEILHQRMWETDSYKSHKDHMQLYEALENSMNRDHSEELVKDLAEARKKKKKSHESPKTPPGSPPHQPPPLPPPAGQSKGSAAPSSSKTAGSAKYQAWMTTDIRLRPSISLTPTDLQMDKDMAPNEQAQSPDDEEIRNAHIPKTSDIAMFMDWFYKRRGITELKRQDLEGPAFKIIKVFHPDVIHLQYQILECHKLLTDSVDASILRHNVSKPLPLGGPPGHVTIQSDFFFNKDLEYLRYDSKDECKYDIDAMYGISHWWFQRQRFYIDRHTSEGDRRAVRTHMRILSVVRIEVFSMYGYDYMKKIVLRRADLNEHVIAEREFKYLYPSDFEDPYLLNLQSHLNNLSPKDKKILTTAVNLWTIHLVIRHRLEDFQLGIESYQTQLNLTKHRWDATGFEYKHDYTVIDSPRTVTFRDRYGVQMMMRFNEIHKKDVNRSKAFMFAIKKHLKTRRIFSNLESFVGGRVRDEDYKLLKLDIEKVAVCSSLRSLKLKRTIESKAKILSKIISLGHYSIMLTSSHTVKSKTDIKSPTHYPCGIARTSKCYISIHSEDGNPARANIQQALVSGFNSVVYSFCALSTLRHSGLRTASTVAKPCQGDSLEFYLITGRILTVAAAGQRDVRQNAMQNDEKEVGQNAVQNPGIQNVENMNGLSVVPEITNQYGNGNVVTAPAEDNDAHEETKRVKVNYTSKDTLQQASTSETQSDNAPIYDSDRSAELEDLKGKSCDTQCAANTVDPLSQKLKDKNVSLESHVLNYAKESVHLKTAYKNLFNSIKVTQAQTNSIIDSLQKQLYDAIYENVKLRPQLFDNDSKQKGNIKGTITNTMFTKQSILGKPPSSSYKPKLYSVTPFLKSLVLPKVDKTNALSKPVTSNTTPSTRESKVV
nr:E-beta-farnesene synthase [Tanacetum cinerariifolium]